MLMRGTLRRESAASRCWAATQRRDNAEPATLVSREGRWQSGNSKHARTRSSSIVWADKDAAPPEHPRRPGLWVIAAQGAPFTHQRI